MPEPHGRNRQPAMILQRVTHRETVELDLKIENV